MIKLLVLKKCSFASSFVPFCLKKDQKKNLVSFLVDSIAREHLASLALAPPEFFDFPGGGVQTPPEFFTFPGGGSWGVLICPPPPGSKTRPPMCHAHAASNSKFKLQTSNYEQTEKKEKKFGQFFGRFHREGASSFFGSEPPPEFFTFP